MSVISSFKQKALFSTVVVSHGVRRPHQIFLTSPWGATTVLNLVSLLVIFGSICDFGLYRDDGLGISKASPRQTERIKKDLCGIFSNYGLKITIEANKKTVNFLDVTLNLSNGKCLAYTKPGNIPLYVNNSSRKVMCCTKSSTVTQSRSATVACLISNRRLMVKINQPYRKRLHHQFPRHSTAEDLQTALWLEIT